MVLESVCPEEGLSECEGPSRRISVLLPPHILHRAGKFLEIQRFGEVAIDARKADVGHRIERAQPVHDHFADGLGRYLALTQRFDPALDAGDKLVEPFLRDAALAAGQRDLTTTISRSWTRSNVVKRAPQPSHWRRRRIAVLSSVGRESFTWLSSCAQNGQRTGQAKRLTDEPADRA